MGYVYLECRPQDAALFLSGKASDHHDFRFNRATSTGVLLVDEDCKYGLVDDVHHEQLKSAGRESSPWYDIPFILSEGGVSDGEPWDSLCLVSTGRAWERMETSGADDYGGAPLVEFSADEQEMNRRLNRAAAFVSMRRLVRDQLAEACADWVDGGAALDESAIRSGSRRYRLDLLLSAAEDKRTAWYDSMSELEREMGCSIDALGFDSSDEFMERTDVDALIDLLDEREQEK